MSALLPRLVLDHVVVAGLRNLSRVELRPARSLNVICGENGQGKTSLIEVIYLLATTRSFRTSRLGELVQHEREEGSVRGELREQGAGHDLMRVQSVGIGPSDRVLRIDGAPPPSVSFYATRSPVVAFHPQELRLSMGAPAERRDLLDRVALFARPELGSRRAAYARALRARQRLLAGPGEPARPAALDAYEALLAEHGAQITTARQTAVEQLRAELGPAFARLGPPGLALEATYAPGGSDDPERARHELVRTRGRDARSRSGSFGPHRDDLLLGIGGRPARTVASQGQHRAITLALKAAELACIAAARCVQPILLLDDVLSELDAERCAALFELLGTTRAQVFLTTSRRELVSDRLAASQESCELWVRGGAVQTRMC
ncbi:MAG: DNA replication and repair protein RecF [Deltaproteobacteria bacterium]|nr:DNA replication and repair protein RecF [Deltaproteobacteria bacterium]